jgi:cell division septum initiation protein DivIVA
VADQLAGLAEENARLREQLNALQEQHDAAAARPSPSEQAVGILATAQQTADEYVAEAEDFSRQMTTEARAQYEEQLSQAREKAGAIIQAAQEARAAIVAAGGGGDAPGTEELQEQVAYLKAFGQATRVQLRAYLEALLRDVETEWGRAHPAVLPPTPATAPDQPPDQGEGASTTFHSNEATEDNGTAAAVPATRSPS